MAEESQSPQPEQQSSSPSRGDHELKLPAADPIWRFLDVPVMVSVRLDKRRAQVREILNLQENSILRLNRSAGENMDLLLSGVRVGAGEVVVIDERMGLRITELGAKSREHQV